MSFMYCNISDQVIINNNEIIIMSSNQKIQKKYTFGFITKHSIIVDDEHKIIYYECSYTNKQCCVTQQIVSKTYHFDKVSTMITPLQFKNTLHGLDNTIKYMILGIYGPFVISCFPKIIDIKEKLLTFYNTRCLPNELLLYIIDIYLSRYHNYDSINKPLVHIKQLEHSNLYDQIENKYMSRHSSLTYSKEGLKYLYQQGIINLSLFSIIDDSYITLTPETYHSKKILFCNDYRTLDDFLIFRDRCAAKIFS